MGRWDLVCVLLLVGCGDKDEGATDADADGVAAGDDCNDGDAEIHPGADEHCNQLDDDCDGDVDEEAVDAVTSFTDADGDGYGRGEGQSACGVPDGRAADAGDCDDANADVSPGAVEICNGGVDDDCDGPADDDDAPTGTQTFYADGDGDGYGAGAPIEACEQTAGLSLDDTDCNDGDAAMHPGAAEMCNGVDDDCDASTGEDGTVAIGTVPYASIQEALDDAAADETVTLCGGTFREQIDVERSVVLEGSGADETIIDGDHAGPVVAVSGSSVDLTVRGVTLRHGLADYVSSLGFAAGGAVQAYAARSLTIQDSVIERSEGEVGGGVLGPDDGHVLIEGTMVRDNEATSGAAGGLALSTSAGGTIEIVDSEITDNVSNFFAAGIAILEGSTGSGRASITDTLIDGNEDQTVESSGGGLVSVAELTLSGVTISNNFADWAGGAYVFGDTEADDATEISFNQASLEGFGGGIFVDTCSWTGGVVSGNVAYLGGGAVLLAGEIRDTVFESNGADGWGGGVYVYDGGVLSDVELTGNVAYNGGGGLIVAAEDESYDAIVDGCTITGNSAFAGGGAQIESPFQSIDTDWGSGATDNDPDDVLFWYDLVTESYIVYDAFGSGEYFECSFETHVCD